MPSVETEGEKNGSGCDLIRAGHGAGRGAGQAGFTLVEMLVVITIIGLIMALVGPRVLNYLAESKVKAARIQIQSFASALDLFYLDAGRFPSSGEGLDALVRPTPGVAAWNGPYLRGGSVPNDPWGTPYIYRVARRTRPLRPDLARLGSAGGRYWQRRRHIVDEHA